MDRYDDDERRDDEGSGFEAGKDGPFEGKSDDRLGDELDAELDELEQLGTAAADDDDVDDGGWRNDGSDSADGDDRDAGERRSRRADSKEARGTMGGFFVKALGWAAGTVALFLVVRVLLWLVVLRYVGQSLDSQFFLSPELSWGLAWGLTAVLFIALWKFLPTAFFGIRGQQGWTAYFVIVAVLFGLSYSWGPQSYFDANGQSERRIVRNDGRIELIGGSERHPVTGRDTEPLTPEAYREYELRKQYRSFADAPPVRPGLYFDEVSNEPKVWYSEPEPGVYDLFPLPGFDPRTGEKLQPIRREIVNDPLNLLRVYDARTGHASPMEGTLVPEDYRAAAGPMPPEPPVYWADEEEEVAPPPVRPALQPSSPPDEPRPASTPPAPPSPARSAAPTTTTAAPPAPAPSPTPSRATSVTTPPRATAAPTPPSPRQTAPAPSAPRSTAQSQTRQRELGQVPADRRAEAAKRDAALSEQIKWPGE